MAKLLLLVASLVALVAAANATFQQKQLRCSDTNSYGSGLTNFQLTCLDNIPSADERVPVTAQWIEKMANPARMLDFIEHCTCTLLSMTMVWETMLTHEIEMLFAVSRDFVEDFDKQVEKILIKQETSNKLREVKGKEPIDLLTVRRNNPLFAGDDGDSLYHYYVLNYIVSNAKTPAERKKFFDRVMKNAAKIYFDLEHLESTYATNTDFPMKHPFTLTMSAACKNLYKSFGPYLEALSMMRNGFKNDMWVYRVVSHDETLFKLVISAMICKIVNGQVADQEAAEEAARLG